jgi:hypothetical protein
MTRLDFKQKSRLKPSRMKTLRKYVRGGGGTGEPDEGHYLYIDSESISFLVTKVSQTQRAKRPTRQETNSE